jgi:hypothetical protein
MPYIVRFPCPLKIDWKFILSFFLHPIECESIVNEVGKAIDNLQMLWVEASESN